MLQRLHGGNSIPLLALDLNHRAYPELAAALRATIDDIIQQCGELTIKEIPHFDHYTLEQLANDLRAILESVAVAVESDDPEKLRSLLESAPRHGFDRFLHDADLLELLMEDRILRGVIVAAIEDELGRRMETDEAASLHATIDVMIQQGVLAMVQSQREKLREAAEAELKFLSFFSHDLRNSMFAISTSLNRLNQQLQQAEEFNDARDLLDIALRSIKHTTNGMRRLLDHERIRRAEPKESVINKVNLRKEIDNIVRQFRDDAESKNMRFNVEVQQEATIETDPDLLNLILQNIIGNAVKHCDCENVRIESQLEQADDRGHCRISVADNGNGIEPEQLDCIFDAFKRGRALGAEGVGLGLAIAAQAAKLLNAKIDVDTQLGQGTTFHVMLPATSKQEHASSKA